MRPDPGLVFLSSKGVAILRTGLPLFCGFRVWLDQFEFFLAGCVTILERTNFFSKFNELILGC